MRTEGGVCRPRSRGRWGLTPTARTARLSPRPVRWSPAGLGPRCYAGGRSPARRRSARRCRAVLAAPAGAFSSRVRGAMLARGSMGGRWMASWAGRPTAGGLAAFSTVTPSRGVNTMRIRICFLALAVFVGLVVAVPGASSKSQPVIPKLIAAGQLKPAVIHLRNGQIKRMPFFSGGVLSTIEQSKHLTSATASSATHPVGASVESLGCSDRAGRRDVRVNQDCTYRRQAETNIAYNPTDPANLVAGMNDSIVGWNQTSLDFSLDGGRHWGSVSTAPFRYRLNAPETLLPTADDPNRHTFTGTQGTLHS